MLFPIPFVANSMICESDLPDVVLPVEVSLRPEGVAALDELNRFFERAVGCDQEMNMVVHEYKVMKVELVLIVLQYL